MEQESECLKKMKNGDLEARNELIERNMRLVAHVAKKYQNPEDEMEDLISIGTIGLIKAVETYKEDYGSRLAYQQHASFLAKWLHVLARAFLGSRAQDFGEQSLHDVFPLLVLRKASLSRCRCDVKLDREVTKGFAKSPHQAKSPSI